MFVRSKEKNQLALEEKQCISESLDIEGRCNIHLANYSATNITSMEILFSPPPGYSLAVFSALPLFFISTVM